MAACLLVIVGRERVEIECVFQHRLGEHARVTCLLTAEPNLAEGGVVEAQNAVWRYAAVEPGGKPVEAGLRGRE